MLTLSGSLRVFLALEPCDMRKSFDGLHALVVTRLGDDPRGGAVFVFINRSHNLIKLLHWDGTGLWVHAKKLQRGTFRWPRPAAASPNGKISLEPAALAMLTDGIDLRDGMRRAWFERE
jgi:transposase